jgi:hypothetical protein
MLASDLDRLLTLDARATLAGFADYDKHALQT